MKIRTLQDSMAAKKPVLMDLVTLNKLGFDISGVGTAISQIWQGLLSLFGGGRKRLTMLDFQNAIPGNGVWHEKLRQYMYAHIQYDTDLKNIQPFTAYFADENGITVQQLEQYLANENAGAADGSKGSGGVVYGGINPLIGLGVAAALIAALTRGNKKKR